MIEIHSWIEKLQKFYKNISTILVSTIVLFILVNIFLWVLIYVRRFVLTGEFGANDTVTYTFGCDLVRKAYPDYDLKTTKALLKETWSRHHTYEPFTQFKERHYEGKYVNVSKKGFRYIKNQGYWPLDENAYNIFIFGGSTMFGYGVCDEETVASYLQEYLRKKVDHKIYVYNFGRGHYYSTQELLLFLSLISQGHVPDAAIFVDGLNEFYHHSYEPIYTQRFRDFMEGNYFRAQKNNIITKLPVYRALKLIRKINFRPKRKNTGYDDKSIISNVVKRYINNKKLIEAIASTSNVTPVFVWQPVPTYKYNLEYHIFSKKGFYGHTYSKYGYPYMRNYINAHPQGKNFI